MKVTISIPDASEERARRAARTAGLNFSQFMSTAADEYSRKVEEQAITDQIDAALKGAHDVGDESHFTARAAELTLRRSEW